MTHFNGDSGFTLLETLVAFLIIGLLAALTLPAIGEATRRDAMAQQDKTVSEEMRSLMALAKAGVATGAQLEAFPDWQANYQAVATTNSFQTVETRWLILEHRPSGQMFRVLVLQ